MVAFHPFNHHPPDFWFHVFIWLRRHDPSDGFSPTHFKNFPSKWIISPINWGEHQGKYIFETATWMSQEVSKWLISGL